MCLSPSYSKKYNPVPKVSLTALFAMSNSITEGEWSRTEVKAETEIEPPEPVQLEDVLHSVERAGRFHYPYTFTSCDGVLELPSNLWRN